MNCCWRSKPNARHTTNPSSGYLRAHELRAKKRKSTMKFQISRTEWKNKCAAFEYVSPAEKAFIQVARKSFIQVKHNAPCTDSSFPMCNAFFSFRFFSSTPFEFSEHHTNTIHVVLAPSISTLSRTILTKYAFICLEMDFFPLTMRFGIKTTELNVSQYFHAVYHATQSRDFRNGNKKFTKCCTAGVFQFRSTARK